MAHTFNPKNFYKPSNTYGFLIIICEWVQIGVCLFLASLSVYCIPISILLIGKSQCTLMDNIGHYATHNTLFKTRSLNIIAEMFCFFPAFVLLHEWKKDHLLHHQSLGQPNDPTYITFNRWGLHKRSFFCCLMLVPLSDLIINIRLLKINRSKALLLFWILVIMGVAAFGAWNYLLIWILSFFITRPYFIFINETAEHWKTEKNHTRWAIGSRILAGIFYVIKPYGDNFHWMHHEYPGIPGHLLKKAYEAHKKSTRHTPQPKTLIDLP